MVKLITSPRPSYVLTADSNGQFAAAYVVQKGCFAVFGTRDVNAVKGVGYSSVAAIVAASLGSKKSLFFSRLASS